MHKVLNNLNVSPELILVDGNSFKPNTTNNNNNLIDHICIIEGDKKYIRMCKYISKRIS